jgi:hypothetical protein
MNAHKRHLKRKHDFIDGVSSVQISSLIKLEPINIVITSMDSSTTRPLGQKGKYTKF